MHALSASSDWSSVDPLDEALPIAKHVQRAIRIQRTPIDVVLIGSRSGLPKK
jgi:hypothetical protein